MDMLLHSNRIHLGFSLLFVFSIRSAYLLSKLSHNRICKSKLILYWLGLVFLYFLIHLNRFKALSVEYSTVLLAISIWLLLYQFYLYLQLGDICSNNSKRTCQIILDYLIKIYVWSFLLSFVIYIFKPFSLKAIPLGCELL